MDSLHTSLNQLYYATQHFGPSHSAFDEQLVHPWFFCFVDFTINHSGRIMTSKKEITSLNRKHGNIKCQLMKMANALQKQTDLSIPELQAKQDVMLKLQNKFQLLKKDYYKIKNEMEYAEAELVLNSSEENMQNLEVSLKSSINEFKYNSQQ
ncbi:uncharacterized protein TNCV_4722391 [Trichonephila clavipes]|uniref:Uncharacterized protein n=1 Tax=Trichonephila clavipes TaxID=2585209 RepID=A0A8X6W7I7_TRICX|nr:uncharacterized protein TNCV_4722391 [Trichonephila clavipes]